MDAEIVTSLGMAAPRAGGQDEIVLDFDESSNANATLRLSIKGVARQRVRYARDAVRLYRLLARIEAMCEEDKE